MPMKHRNSLTFDSNESLQFDYAGLVLPRSPAVFYANITYETAAFELSSLFLWVYSSERV